MRASLRVIASPSPVPPETLRGRGFGWVNSSNLAFYGIDNIELHRQTAIYVDRLKGEKPGDLPIQNATKFELVINMKAAKAVGIDPPNSLLARTDEVIE
jgi:putative ABC transport system substrate-binding protein